MALLLTAKQKEEMNKSILSYFDSLGMTKVVEAFMEDAKIPKDDKFKDILEKKWRSIDRLEKRIDQLIEQNREVELEISTFGQEGKVVESDVLPDPGRDAKHTITGHRGPIVNLAFHPRFNLLVTVSEDNTVKIWDADNGAYARTLSGHTDVVQYCTFNSDGSILATTSTDTTIRLWDFGKENNGTFKTTKTLLGHDHTVSGAAFSKDGELLFTGSRDKTIKMWEVTTGHCKKTFKGHTDWVKVVKVSPDQNQLASCGLDQTICVWDIKTGNCLTTLRDHDHVVESIAWSNKISDRNIMDNLLDKDDQKLCQAHLQTLTDQQKEHVGGMFLISGSRDKTLRLWMVFDGVCVKTIRGHDNWLRGVLFHPSGRYILSCADDKTVRVWDLVKQARCKSVIVAHESFVSCLAWNMHTPMMATGCVDNSVKIFECR